MGYTVPLIFPGRTPDDIYGPDPFQDYRQNTGAGLADETTVTTGNSGGTSGTAFDQITGTWVADTDDAPPGYTRSYRAAAVTGTATFLRLPITASAYLTFEVWVKLTGYPSATCEWLRWSSTVYGSVGGLNLMTTGAVQNAQSPFTAAGTVCPLNVWHRQRVLFSGGVQGKGRLNWQAFDAAGSLITSISIPASASGPGSSNLIYFGKGSASGNLAEYRFAGLRVASNRTTYLDSLVAVRRIGKRTY